MRENLRYMSRVTTVLVYCFLLGDVTFREDEFMLLSTWCLVHCTEIDYCSGIFLFAVCVRITAREPLFTIVDIDINIFPLLKKKKKVKYT
jgi:hypothetical protein